MIRKKTTSKTKAEYDRFTSPESSNVEGGVYNLHTKEAVIAFRDKKKEGSPSLFYSYFDVLDEDWKALKAADSKGRHMAKVFTKKYKGELIV